MKRLLEQVVVAVLLCGLSVSANAQGDNRGPGGALGNGAPDFAPDELSDAMNDLVPGSGDAFLQDYNNGGFHLGELMTPNGVNGAADADTILIDSRYNDGDPKNDLATCADTAIHEHMHWQNAQGSTTGEDPTTSDPVCGGCNHASMHMTHLGEYIERACDEDETSTIDYCELAWNNLSAAATHMGTCSNLCPSHDSTDDALATLDEAFRQCCE